MGYVLQTNRYPGRATSTQLINPNLTRLKECAARSPRASGRFAASGAPASTNVNNQRTSSSRPAPVARFDLQISIALCVVAPAALPQHNAFKMAGTFRLRYLAAALVALLASAFSEFLRV